MQIRTLQPLICISMSAEARNEKTPMENEVTVHVGVAEIPLWNSTGYLFVQANLLYRSNL